jgi:hypothetical protein
MDRWWCININNNSDENISVCGMYINDTCLPENKPAYIIEIKPNRIGNLQGYMVGDSKLERLDKESITIFVFDTDSINCLTWDYIKVNNVVLKKFQGTINDFPQDNGPNFYYP